MFSVDFESLIFFEYVDFFLESMISIALREKNATVILTFWYYTYIYECADTYTNHSVSKFDPN